jgi:GH24 family phage-related lysozyme (muramidase)
MASLKQLLTLRECKDGKPSMKVYKDSRGFLTVGIGHKVVSADKLKLGDEIDDARVDAFFTA